MIHLHIPMAGCSGLTLVGHQTPTKSSLSLPSVTGQGEKIEQKVNGLRQGEITHQIASQAKQTRIRDID